MQVVRKLRKLIESWLMYHPDKNPKNTAAEETKEAAEAYSVLSDDTKRQKYDQFGHQGIGGSGGFGVLVIWIWMIDSKRIWIWRHFWRRIWVKQRKEKEEKWI